MRGEGRYDGWFQAALAREGGELEAVKGVEQTASFCFDDLYLVSNVLHGFDLVIVGYVVDANVGITRLDPCGRRGVV